jgi:hypothetical protein
MDRAQPPAREDSSAYASESDSITLGILGILGNLVICILRYIDLLQESAEVDPNVTISSQSGGENDPMPASYV